MWRVHKDIHTHVFAYDRLNTSQKYCDLVAKNPTIIINASPSPNPTVMEPALCPAVKPLAGPLSTVTPNVSLTSNK